MNWTSKSLRLVIAAIDAVSILTVASAAEPYRLDKTELTTLAAKASTASKPQS